MYWMEEFNNVSKSEVVLKVDYLRFYVPLKNFSLIWRRHHCRWRAANLRLCSALRALKQGGIFIVPHLLWQGASVFPVSSDWLIDWLIRVLRRFSNIAATSRRSEGPPHLVTSYDTRGDVEDLFWPGSSRGVLKEKKSAAYVMIKEVGLKEMENWYIIMRHGIKDNI
jgi:hypothetical protein